MPKKRQPQCLNGRPAEGGQFVEPPLCRTVCVSLVSGRHWTKRERAFFPLSTSQISTYPFLQELSFWLLNCMNYSEGKTGDMTTRWCADQSSSSEAAAAAAAGLPFFGLGFVAALLPSADAAAPAAAAETTSSGSIM